MGEGERQGWLSTRNLRSFLQVESARQNATFIFGRERRETGENVGHVKFCCNSASEVEDMKHSRLVGLFVALLGVLALFSSLNKPGVAALRGPFASCDAARSVLRGTRYSSATRKDG